MGFRGRDRIARRLGVKRLTRAEAPQLFSIVEEYCRRLAIPVPQIGVIETPALNSALFGFHRSGAYLVVTRGVLETFSREKLCALVGRQVTNLWQGDFICHSWLSQFLKLLDRVTHPARSRGAVHSRRFYPFKLFLRQVLLYPLTMFPAYVLKVSQNPVQMDHRSAKLTRLPRALGEVLRHLESMQERIPYQSPVSLRHLFILPPTTQDPLARVFFHTPDFSERIEAVSSLQTLVNLT